MLDRSSGGLPVRRPLVPGPHLRRPLRTINSTGAPDLVLRACLRIPLTPLLQVDLVHPCVRARPHLHLKRRLPACCSSTNCRVDAGVVGNPLAPAAGVHLPLDLDRVRHDALGPQRRCERHVVEGALEIGGVLWPQPSVLGLLVAEAFRKGPFVRALPHEDPQMLADYVRGCSRRGKRAKRYVLPGRRRGGSGALVLLQVVEQPRHPPL
mmetsp:Transcript_81158/g.219855  ORF Transcript_81158/g.219855 Transcript_81158/m.219855 type:complete len:209 (+) Transcript_81158:462-1088(+)